MSAYPSAPVILEAVSRFLRDELLPATDSRLGFHLRVSINAIDLVVRDLKAGEAAAAAELEGLRSLLGEAGALEPLRDRLAQAIADGAPELDRDALMAHLRRTAIAQLAIDQPTYSAYRAAQKAGEAPDGV